MRIPAFILLCVSCLLLQGCVHELGYAAAAAAGTAVVVAKDVAVGSAMVVAAVL